MSELLDQMIKPYRLSSTHSERFNHKEERTTMTRGEIPNPKAFMQTNYNSNDFSRANFFSTFKNIVKGKFFNSENEAPKAKFKENDKKFVQTTSDFNALKIKLEKDIKRDFQDKKKELRPLTSKCFFITRDEKEVTHPNKFGFGKNSLHFNKGVTKEHPDFLLSTFKYKDIKDPNSYQSIFSQHKGWITIKNTDGKKLKFERIKNVFLLGKSSIRKLSNASSMDERNRTIFKFQGK